MLLLPLLPTQSIPILRRPHHQHALRRPHSHRHLLALRLLRRRRSHHPPLHRRHHLPHRHVSIPSIPQQNLSHVRRREGPTRTNAPLGRLEQRVRLHPEVVPRQLSKRVHPARAEADVDVHASTAHERRVHAVPVVRRENHNPLFATARPQPVGEIQKPRKRHSPTLLATRKRRRLRLFPLQRQLPALRFLRRPVCR
ncbi:hypothetical protein Fmac_018496 [Flemingia macrophylla]|uniref:Uncharacterized protein n=1 Tax=Flemingia macrophylla TaxID=520843 RepID=A0ABD1M545_9FABA